MLFRVSFWNDRADTEVFGKTVEAENECEAEGKFFDELEDENDYSDEYPVLVQETKEEPAKSDFEKVFVLTHSSSKKNWLPVVSKSKEVIEKAFKEKLKELLVEQDYDPENDPEPTKFYDGEPLNSAIDLYDYGNDWAEIIYCDDNYDELEIYEVEIK